MTRKSREEFYATLLAGIILGIIVAVAFPVRGASVWDAVGHDAWVDQPRHYEHPVQPAPTYRGDCK